MSDINENIDNKKNKSVTKTKKHQPWARTHNHKVKSLTLYH
jgi:hypothetical protein